MFEDIGYSNIILEVGIGDGILLNVLCNKHKNIYYIGVENNINLFEKANSNICCRNVMIINDTIESTLEKIPNTFLNKVIIVFPDPKFINLNYKNNWKSLYLSIFKKLKNNGILEIITEVTDPLFREVTNDLYEKTIFNLINIFKSIGYYFNSWEQEIPYDYNSFFIEKFKKYPNKIKVVTLNFQKSFPRYIQ
jgi:tRNA G46 methylase TrmB